MGSKKASKEKGGPSRADRRPAPDDPRDAIALLREDHENLRALFDRLTRADGVRRRTHLLEELQEAIQLHSMAEEEIFYPAFRKAVTGKRDREVLLVALEEHNLVSQYLLPELAGTLAGRDEFTAKARVLRDLVERHAAVEEARMFARARKAMDRSQLAVLGRRIAERRNELIASAVV